MNKQANIIVLGAGIVGLSAARQLAELGATVIVLDPSSPGGQGSRAAAGVAVPSLRLLDDPIMLDFVTVAKATLTADLDSLSIRNNSLCRGEGILRIATDSNMQASLEAAAVHHPEWLGQWISADKIVELEPALAGTALLGGFLDETARMVDADAYITALLHDARGRGVDLHIGEGAIQVCEDKDKVRVTTYRGSLSSDWLIVAAGAWSGLIAGLPSLPIRPLRGQMLTLMHPQMSISRIISGAVGYLAPWRCGEIVVGATEEEAGFANHTTPIGLFYLTSVVARMAPSLRQARLTQSWAGLRSVSPNGRVALGRYPGTNRVMLAAGHSGQGILAGALSGKIVAELIDQGTSLIAEAFDPSTVLG